VHRSKLHKWIPQLGLHSYPHSVATTWLMSFQVVRTRNPPGAELFQLLAFLNPDGVRVDFLQAGAEALGDQKKDVRQLLSNQIEMAKALLELGSFSLLKWDRTAKTLLVHRLVQAVVKDEMSDIELTTFRITVIDLCCGAFPDDWDSFEGRVACRNCVGQVMTPLLDAGVAHTKKAALIMSNVGLFLGEDGKFKDSQQLLTSGLEISSQIYGQDHSKTLRLMGDLAVSYWRQGKTGEAATLLEEVVQKEKHILGDNDPETLTRMCNLAVMYLDLGKIKEAAVLQEEALQKKMQILAHNHPATLTSMHVLALIYKEQGKMGEAATLQEAVCKKRKQILGDDHPDTLASLNNLASTYHDQGKLEEARALQEEILQKTEQLLGNIHPSTLTSMSNLALTKFHQGKLEEARALQEEIFQKSTQTDSGRETPRDTVKNGRPYIHILASREDGSSHHASEATGQVER